MSMSGAVHEPPPSPTDPSPRLPIVESLPPESDVPEPLLPPLPLPPPLLPPALPSAENPLSGFELPHPTGGAANASEASKRSDRRIPRLKHLSPLASPRVG